MKVIPEFTIDEIYVVVRVVKDIKLIRERNYQALTLRYDLLLFFLLLRFRVEN